MKSEAYWSKRFETLSEAQLNKGEKYIETLNREYAKATAEIQRDIEVFYQRFAKNNEVSYAEARQMLTKGQLKEFRWTVQEYIQKGRENAVDQRWMKELENASIKVRVSRLEALQTQMRAKVETLAAKRQTGTQDVLSGIYKDGYYRSVYELQKGAGVGTSFAKLDSRQVESLLATPWAPDGKNFSSRIWEDRTKLVAELQTTLVQGLVRGDSSEKMISALSERMGVSRSNAARLVMTESAYFSGQSRLDAYREMEVEEYKFTAALDRKTSPMCQGMDGKVFPISEAKAGINYPPLHSHCRSTTIPHYDDNVKERAARDEDGKTYDVPGDMTYEQWKKEHVDKPQAAEPPELSKNDIMESKEPVAYRKFESPSQVKDWEAEVSPGWLDTLSEKEKAAIKKYTGSSYHDINKNLRENGSDESLHKVSNEISSGLRKFNLADNIVVYRGLSKNIFQKPADQLVGVIFTEPAFASTSLLSSSSFGGSVQLEIRVPAGSKGAIVNPLSVFKDSEYEFLLDKGTMFEVIEAKEVNGTIYIIAEVLAVD
ncbi:ADP-ribosyltransferase [Paenibacillus ehimensis]|uniref:ADP-ribosyltransferase n=1 Tax=Paenibacillus ehimensis TaxID=79264 RepID=UPI003D293BD9